MKNIIKNWLEKLAKANEESFGTERLDCCDLNKSSNLKNTKNTNIQTNNDIRNKKK